MYCRVSCCVGLKWWTERGGLAQSSSLCHRSHLNCIHSFIGHFRFHVLAQILAHLVAEVDPSNGLAACLCWLCSHLGCDSCLLQQEALLMGVDLLDQPPPHVRQPQFFLIHVCSLLACT